MGDITCAGPPWRATLAMGENDEWSAAKPSGRRAQTHERRDESTGRDRRPGGRCQRYAPTVVATAFRAGGFRLAHPFLSLFLSHCGMGINNAKNSLLTGARPTKRLTWRPPAGPAGAVWARLPAVEAKMVMQPQHPIVRFAQASLQKGKSTVRPPPSHCRCRANAVRRRTT